MSLDATLFAVRRHWLTVLVVLIVTGVATVRVPQTITPEYKVDGSVILLSPAVVPSETGDVEVNPWSRLSGAESGAAAALVQSVRLPIARLLTADDEPVKAFDIGTNAGNGAIIDLSVTANSESGALQAFDRGTSILEDELQSRQKASGAPEDSWLTIDLLSAPSNAVMLPGSRLRAAAAIALLGIIAAISLAVLLESTVTSRLHDRIRPEKPPTSQWRSARQHHHRIERGERRSARSDDGPISAAGSQVDLADDCSDAWPVT